MPLRSRGYLWAIRRDILLFSITLRCSRTRRRALREAVDSSTAELLEAAIYGLAKVSRRFYMVLKSFIFALAKAVMHVITLATGGFTAAFTETAAMALTLTDSTINVGLAIKGAYKAFAGTRGVNRSKNAEVIVRAAMSEFSASPDDDPPRSGPALKMIQRFGINITRVSAAIGSPPEQKSLIQEVMPHLKSK